MPFETDKARFFHPNGDPKLERYMTALESQKAAVFRHQAALYPCPVCQQPNNWYTATGDAYSIDDPDEFEELVEWYKVSKSPDFKCSACGEPLRFMVYVFGGDGWATYRKPGQATQPTEEEVKAWKVAHYTELRDRQRKYDEEQKRVRLQPSKTR